MPCTCRPLKLAQCFSQRCNLWHSWWLLSASAPFDMCPGTWGCLPGSPGGFSLLGRHTSALSSAHCQLGLAWLCCQQRGDWRYVFGGVRLLAHRSTCWSAPSRGSLLPGKLSCASFTLHVRQGSPYVTLGLATYSRFRRDFPYPRMLSWCLRPRQPLHAKLVCSGSSSRIGRNTLLSRLLESC